MKLKSARLTLAGASLPEPSVFGRTPASGQHSGGRPRRPVDLAEVGRLLMAGHSFRAAARSMHLGEGTL